MGARSPRTRPSEVTPEVVGCRRASASHLIGFGSLAGPRWLERIQSRRRLEQQRQLEEQRAADEALANNSEVELDVEEGTPLELSPRERTWAVVLAFVSALDMMGSTILTIAAFCYAFKHEGISLYCVGIQGISHLGSSFILVLRFLPELLPPREDESQGLVSDAEILRERRKEDLSREQNFAVFMGFSMLISCVALLIKAVRKFCYWDEWYLDHDQADSTLADITAVLAWCGCLGYMFQASVRLLAARKVHRSVAWHACMVSVVSWVYFFVLGVASSYERAWSWKAEPIAAVALVLAMLVESVRMVIGNLGDIESELRFNPLM